MASILVRVQGSMSASKAKRILWTNSFWKWGKTTWVTYTLMMPIHALNEARKGENWLVSTPCEWITPTPQRGKSTFTSIQKTNKSSL
jgi:hypothetical protein